MSKADQIAQDFAEQFALAMDTPQGADKAAICEALAEVHGVTPEDVDRIQLEHAVAGPC